MEDSFHFECDDELFGEDWLQCYATCTLDTKYENADVRETVDCLTHLSAQQNTDLLKILLENQKMFDSTLSLYPHCKVHIEIDPNAKPKHSRAYPVPRIHLSTFKRELDHLVKVGILAVQGESKWCSPSFITPKKDGRVR